jgi:uncharacterized membrane protein
VFFGYVFGPVVGFFTGAVGNLLGDFLSTWGVYPTWDIGNGLIGFVAGLPLLFMNREKSLNLLTWIAGLLVVLSAGFIFLNANIEDPLAWRGITDFGPFAWVLLGGGVVALLTRLLISQLGEGTALMNLWGVIGVVVGIGYAAIGDIWVSGYTFVVTMVGQFAPAASWNILFAVVLAPLLLVAYNAVQQRAGR